MIHFQGYDFSRVVGEHIRDRDDVRQGLSIDIHTDRKQTEAMNGNSELSCSVSCMVDSSPFGAGSRAVLSNDHHLEGVGVPATLTLTQCCQKPL